MPTTRVHRFCDTQPTTSFALLRIQLIILPMIPGRALAALIPNWPNRDAKALSFDLTHSFGPFQAILIAVSMEAIVIPCSLIRVRIFSANEVSLSNTLAIVFQKLVI